MNFSKKCLLMVYFPFISNYLLIFNYSDVYYENKRSSEFFLRITDTNQLYIFKENCFWTFLCSYFYRNIGQLLNNKCFIGNNEKKKQ